MNELDNPAKFDPYSNEVEVIIQIETIEGTFLLELSYIQTYYNNSRLQCGLFELSFGKLAYGCILSFKIC